MKASRATFLGVVTAAALTCSPALAESFVFHCYAAQGHCVFVVLHNGNNFIDMGAGEQHSTGDFNLGDTYYVAAIPIDPRRGCRGVSTWCYGPRRLVRGVNS